MKSKFQICKAIALSFNPFSTRHFQPGEIPFHFRDGQSAETLIQKADQRTGRCWLIVGPHGTGKSTLLRNLESTLRTRIDDDAIESLWLRPGESPWSNLRRSMSHWKSRNAILIDGLEQVAAPMRWYALSRVARYRLLCIATSHRVWLGCQSLWETTIDREVEGAVVAHLLRNQSRKDIDEMLQSEAWRQSRARRKENLRESLFDMYDWWQAR